MADTNTVLRKKIARVLEEQGFEVVHNGIGADLEKFCSEEKPDILVCGVVLSPKSDEFRLLKGIQEKGGLSGIKLLLLTEIPSPEKTKFRKRKRVEIDCDAFCNKPVDVMELISSVRRLGAA